MAWNKRQREAANFNTDVYRIFDAHGNLLYVGCAVNVFSRFRGHRPYAQWWNESDTAVVEQYANRHLARHMEAVIIRDEKPRYNVTQELSELRRPAPEGDLEPIETLQLWREGNKWWVDG